MQFLPVAAVYQLNMVPGRGQSWSLHSAHRIAEEQHTGASWGVGPAAATAAAGRGMKGAGRALGDCTPPDIDGGCAAGCAGGICALCAGCCQLGLCCCGGGRAACRKDVLSSFQSYGCTSWVAGRLPTGGCLHACSHAQHTSGPAAVHALPALALTTASHKLCLRGQFCQRTRTCGAGACGCCCWA